MKNEWISILDWIGENALSQSCRNLLKNIKPLSKKEAQNEFKALRETATVVDTGTNIFSYDMDKVHSVLERFDMNEPLEPCDYRTIGDFLELLRKNSSLANELDYAENLNSLLDFKMNISLEMTIKQSVNEKGEVSSNASPELAKVRKQLTETHKKVAAAIRKMVRHPDFSGFLQEDWFTIRDDRYVLPFKSAFKRKMKGVIHNYSRTGQTAFLEPLPLIELNNSLSLLANRELEETIKVLKELRGLLFREYKYVSKCISTAAHLETLYTKYKWMKKFSCCIPEFKDRNMNLKEAWYPPVFISEQEKTVKNDFNFSDDERIMVVSGPNAGGKTVSLKTVATAAYLAVRGFPVPAKSAQLPYFEDIFMVLGDNQSAVAGESSFSSHLKLLNETAANANSSSLVLIDEIGTGTDPLQGGAISRAYLEFLSEKNCYAVVTSHLAEVKTIALEDRHFIPVAMGFDKRTSKPNYRFMYNLVGSSNAMALVKEIGFPKSFIKKLEKLLLTKEENIEPLINRLRKKEDELDALRKEIEASKETVKKEKEEIEKLRKSLETKEKTFEKERLQSLKKLMDIEEAEMKKKIKKLDAAKATKKIAVIKKEKETVKDALNRQKVQLDETKGDKLSDVKDKVIKGKTLVYDKLLKLEGTLQNIKGKNIEYTCKGKRLSAPIDRIIVKELKQKTKTVSQKSQMDTKFVEKCDVRGQFTEDAAEVIEKALDSAYGGGAISLTIVHGIGSGKLRNFIRSFLEKYQGRYKYSFEAGTREEGGDSVTVVKFEK